MAHRVAGDCPAADGRRRLCEVPRKALALCCADRGGSVPRAIRSLPHPGEKPGTASSRPVELHRAVRGWTGTSTVWAQKGEYLPDDSRLLFEVVCKGCSRSLMTVERIRDPEIDAFVDHLRA